MAGGGIDRSDISGSQLIRWIEEEES